MGQKLKSGLRKKKYHFDHLTGGSSNTGSSNVLSDKTSWKLWLSKKDWSNWKASSSSSWAKSLEWTAVLRSLKSKNVS